MTAIEDKVESLHVGRNDHDAPVVFGELLQRDIDFVLQVFRCQARVDDAVSLGDTLGKAKPDQIGSLLELLLKWVPARALAGHFHDTSGQALENIKLCLAAGLRTFDASIGGLGGCPYAPGAQGNVATEAVCQAMADWGFETGVDLERLTQVSAFARKIVSAKHD